MISSEANPINSVLPLGISLKTIAVPIDFSDHSSRALDFALVVARQFGATLRLVHVHRTGRGTLAAVGTTASLPAPELPMTEPRRARNEELQALKDRLDEVRQRCDEFAVPCDVEIAAESGSVHRSIVEQANRHGTDLIIMGTHGRSGFSRALLGSVAEGVLRHSSLPVLVIPPQLQD